MTAVKTDVYQSVTDRVITALEAGTVPWCPDHVSARPTMPVRHNGVPYRGINTVLLWLSGHVGGYTSPRWLTFRQAKEEGGNVRKGEKGTPVVFFRMLERPSKKDAAKTDRIPMIRQYTVFNQDQCDGVLKLDVPAPAVVNPDSFAACEPPLMALQAKAASARFYPDCPVPAYRFGDDTIHMPSFDRFKSGESFLSTFAHEAVHSTGHAVRLDRWPDGPCGDIRKAEYQREELVAELGAAFCCARLGVRNHYDRAAGYIAAFLRLLKEDAKAVVRASAAAAAACDFLLGGTDTTDDADE